MAEPSPDELHKVFTAILSNIGREDSNTGQRVGWAISLSAGLFAAISFMAPRINDSCNGAFWPPMICLAISGVAGLGFFFSMKSWRGVRAAHRQIDYLRGQYERLEKQFERLHLPRPYGDSTDEWGLESASIFPRTLMIFWSIILGGALIGSVVTLARAATDPIPRCEKISTTPAPAQRP